MKDREAVWPVLFLSGVLLAGCRSKQHAPSDPQTSAAPLHMDQVHTPTLQAVSSDSAVPEAAAGYQASCAMSGQSSANGSIANQGLDTYQLSGMVTFSFSGGANAAVHPSVQISAASVIPPGQTVLVASANLPFQAAPGEQCSFDPGASLHKFGP